MANEKRLIDANVLVEWLKRVGSFLKCTANHKMMTKNIGKIIDHIESMPTVDAVYEVYGRWKGAGLGDYLCSACWERVSGGNRFKYCPNCGAKMDGDGNG